MNINNAATYHNPVFCVHNVNRPLNLLVICTEYDGPSHNIYQVHTDVGCGGKYKDNSFCMLSLDIHERNL